MENKVERGHTKLTNMKSYKIQVIRGIAMVLCQDLVQVKMRNFSPF